MIRWSLLQLVRTALLLAAVMVLTWGLLEALPGDPCTPLLGPDTDPRTLAAMRAALGCDDGAAVRFWLTLRNVATLDLGVSLQKHVPVRDLLADALPETILLGAAALAIGQTLGVALGVVQAVNRGKALDPLVSAVTLALSAMPSFVLGLGLMYLTAWFDPTWPITGSSTPWLTPSLGERAQALLLPALTLGLGSAAVDARFVRSAMIAVLAQDFVRTARAKGLPEWRVVLVHALRNALLPTIALVGLQLPLLASGAVVAETIFAWPGMGRVMVEAVRASDTPVVLGGFYGFALLVAVGGALTELAAAWADPRIRVRG